jgi:hypothetical protein
MRDCNLTKTLRCSVRGRLLPIAPRPPAPAPGGQSVAESALVRDDDVDDGDEPPGLCIPGQAARPVQMPRLLSPISNQSVAASDDGFPQLSMPQVYPALTWNGDTTWLPGPSMSSRMEAFQPYRLPNNLRTMTLKVLVSPISTLEVPAMLGRASWVAKRFVTAIGGNVCVTPGGGELWVATFVVNDRTSVVMSLAVQDTTSGPRGFPVDFSFASQDWVRLGGGYILPQPSPLVQIAPPAQAVQHDHNNVFGLLPSNQGTSRPVPLGGERRNKHRARVGAWQWVFWYPFSWCVKANRTSDKDNPLAQEPAFDPAVSPWDDLNNPNIR